MNEDLLGKCRACGRQVSRKALECPDCREPNPVTDKVPQAVTEGGATEEKENGGVAVNGYSSNKASIMASIAYRVHFTRHVFPRGLLRDFGPELGGKIRLNFHLRFKEITTSANVLLSPARAKEMLNN